MQKRCSEKVLKTLLEKLKFWEISIMQKNKNFESFHSRISQNFPIAEMFWYKKERPKKANRQKWKVPKIFLIFRENFSTILLDNRP